MPVDTCCSTCTTAVSYQAEPEAGQPTGHGAQDPEPDRLAAYPIRLDALHHTQNVFDLF